MNKIQIYARMKIHPDEVEAFKTAAARCLAITAEKDRGTEQYDWFIDDAGGECVIREQYRDSEAVLQHLGNLGEALGELFSHADVELDLCGDPSPELLEAGSGMKVSLYRYLQGL
jgi:quinol monooxygenase YgiN